MTSRSRLLPLSCLLLLAAACGEASPDPGGAADVAAPADDVGAADAKGALDAATPDAGPGDVWVGPEVVPEGPIGGDRPAEVYLPAAYDPAQAWPLVVVLHGFTADGWSQDIYFQTSELRDEFGAIVLIPEGTENPEGSQFWNATPACCDFFGADVDDVGYLLGLIAEARTLWHVDRVVLVGHSNGGFMAHRLACEAADRIAAIASLAGSTLAQATDCQPSAPVAMLQMHGTQDGTIPFEGKIGYPSAQETAARWVTYNACESGPEVGEPADYDLFADGPETTPETWSGCAGGVEVALWTMQDSAHIPTPNQPDFGRAILGWLLAQPW